MRCSKILIKLYECADRSESSLGARPKVPFLTLWFKSYHIHVCVVIHYRHIIKSEKLITEYSYSVYRRQFTYGLEIEKRKDTEGNMSMPDTKYVFKDNSVHFYASRLCPETESGSLRTLWIETSELRYPASDWSSFANETRSCAIPSLWFHIWLDTTAVVSG